MGLSNSVLIAMVLIPPRAERALTVPIVPYVLVQSYCFRMCPLLRLSQCVDVLSAGASRLDTGTNVVLFVLYQIVLLRASRGVASRPVLFGSAPQADRRPDPPPDRRRPAQARRSPPSGAFPGYRIGNQRQHGGQSLRRAGALRRALHGARTGQLRGRRGPRAAGGLSGRQAARPPGPRRGGGPEPRLLPGADRGRPRPPVGPMARATLRRVRRALPSRAAFRRAHAPHRRKQRPGPGPADRAVTPLPATASGDLFQRRKPRRADRPGAGRSARR